MPLDYLRIPLRAVSKPDGAFHLSLLLRCPRQSEEKMRLEGWSSRAIARIRRGGAGRAFEACGPASNTTIAGGRRRTTEAILSWEYESARPSIAGSGICPSSTSGRCHRAAGHAGIRNVLSRCGAAFQVEDDRFLIHFIFFHGFTSLKLEIFSYEKCDVKLGSIKYFLYLIFHIRLNTITNSKTIILLMRYE